MFDNLIEGLKRFENGRIPVSIPIDGNGDIDRRCPDDNCSQHFKVNLQDLKTIAKDELFHCPVCGHEAPTTEWNTPEQSEYLKAQAINYVKESISSAMRQDVAAFNSKAQKGFISMSLSYVPGTVQLLVPPNVANELTQHYHCDGCKFRYALLGIAYFCPSCGKPNTFATIEESLNLLRTFQHKVDAIKLALEAVYTPEETGKLLVLMIEEHFCKIVSVLQKHCENLFAKSDKPADLEVRRNLFQNLADSSVIWRQLYGKGYEDILDQQTYTQLLTFYQQRHLLIHTNGIVDVEYIAKTSDVRYSVGQRIIIRPNDLGAFLDVAAIFIRVTSKNYS